MPKTKNRIKNGIRNRNVVVITGASTGIGRATALEFAHRGARLALAARQIEKLEDVARDCAALGAECLCVSVDVADAAAVERLAAEARARFGRIDAWVNNAGVGVLGSFTDVPIADHRRVIETNVIGYLNGAHAALRVFKEQGHGVLVNNASISARLSTPNLASYTASKFAIRGLTHSLRQDLALEGRRDIHVCQVNPAVVDTPAFQHTANYSGLPIRIRIPMVTAEQVAQAIVSLVERPRREIFVGWLGRLGSWAYTFFPGLTARILIWGAKFYYASGDQKKPPTSGNLFKPVTDATATAGGWKSGQTSEV